MTIGLAIAAVVVAIATAVVQFLQNRRLASRAGDLQERVATIEEARRRDELRPQLRLQFVRNPGDDDGWLEWINDGPVDLDDVAFTLIERGGAGWQPLRGVRFVREGLTLAHGALGPMKIGEPVLHGLVRTPGSEREGGTARFRITSRSAGESWDTAVQCEIPPVT